MRRRREFKIESSKQKRLEEEKCTRDEIRERKKERNIDGEEKGQRRE